MRMMCVAAVLLAGVMAMAGEPSKVEQNPAVAANNAFACDLFKKLAEENPGKNVFYSPYSISAALGMTLEGARGETARQMGELLRLPASLRQEGDQPWQTVPYGQGLADIARRLASERDPAKAEAIRKQVAELRNKLAEVNRQIQGYEKTGKFREVGALSLQAAKLATQINTLAQQVDQYELKVANALWGEKTYPFDKAYLQAVDRIYGTGHLQLADFKNNYPAERAKINKWVEEQTANRIKDLLPALSQEEARLLSLVLVNAIYFKGEWSQPFEEKFTKTEDFLLADGGKKPAQLMHHAGMSKARYAAFSGDGNFFDTPRLVPLGGGKVQTYPDRDGFLIAELPYKGDKLSMVLIAPQKVDGLPALEAKLTGENLTKWLGKLQERTVHVIMPRFKLETDYKLAETLRAMGMKKPFEERGADFSAMTTSSNPDDKLHISRVLHKAFVEVNEKGAEAAAATAVMMARPTSAPVNRPFDPTFRADRPFLFLIRDAGTGTVLFMGRLNQPT